eukprot:jgi/Bigna1/46563/estExt_Genewise1.C_50154
MSEGKKRVFRRFFYRGYEVEKLLDLQNEEFIALLHSRARRRFSRFGVKTKLVNKIKNAIKKSEPGKKPEIIKTHLRNMIIVPTMVGGLLGVYNGKGYILVEVKPDMIGHYLGEFALTYNPVKHGRPGAGTGPVSRFLPT